MQVFKTESERVCYFQYNWFFFQKRILLWSII